MPIRNLLKIIIIKNIQTELNITLPFFQCVIKKLQFKNYFFIFH